MTATVLGALWALSAGADVNAGYFETTAEFSATQGNPNGVWTYGWMSKDFAKFTPYDGIRVDASKNTVWYRTSPASGDFTPCVWLNKSGTTLYGAAPGQLVLHPSSDTEASVVRWTAPAPGFYRIRGQFFPGDSGKMSVGVRRTRYDNFFSSGSASGMFEQFLWTATDSGTFDIFYSTDNDSHLSYFMTGESVDFVVYGGYGSGNTPLRAEIIRQTSPVPVYEASSEFGIDQGNPNGAWRYGWMPTDFSSFTPFSGRRQTPNSATQWYRSPPSSDFTPTLWRNEATVAQYGVPSGMLSLHPSDTFEASVLRWTAPMPGNYWVRARFLPGDSGRMKIGVRKTTFKGGQATTTWEWQANDSGFFETGELWTEAGAIYDFVVYGGYASGNTPVEVVIVAQPFWIDNSLKLRRYDPTAEFGTASNPNGVWTYGWMTKDLTAFTPYAGVTPASATRSAAWWRSPQSADFTPTIWLNNPDGGATYGVAPGELALHPSDSNEGSVLRFTAPVSGTYGVNARFLPGDIGAMSVVIRQGGQQLWSARNAGSIHLYRDLRENESLDFMVSGGYAYGNTPLQLTVTPQVIAPTAVVTGCYPVQPNGLEVSGEGTCEYGTAVVFDGTVGGMDCGPDGRFQFSGPTTRGTSTITMRGMQSGRAPSERVSVSLDPCPY